MLTLSKPRCVTVHLYVMRFHKWFRWHIIISLQVQHINKWCIWWPSLRRLSFTHHRLDVGSYIIKACQVKFPMQMACGIIQFIVVQCKALVSSRKPDSHLTRAIAHMLGMQMALLCLCVNDWETRWECRYRLWFIYWHNINHVPPK